MKLDSLVKFSIFSAYDVCDKVKMKDKKVYFIISIDDDGILYYEEGFTDSDRTVIYEGYEFEGTENLDRMVLCLYQQAVYIYSQETTIRKKFLTKKTKTA